MFAVRMFVIKGASVRKVSAECISGIGDARLAKRESVAKMTHGLPLQARWNGSGAPPIHANAPTKGSPAIEVDHPFHFKMTPGAMLGPRCNHDLGVLLRLFEIPDVNLDEQSDQSRKVVVNAMLEAIGDHEHYCASYSSKDQPHIDGLMATLSDGL